MDKTAEIASVFLGKKVEGSETYDKSLIVPIPRVENRKAYNIDENNLPFKGLDVWDAYEFSSLTTNNVPFTEVLKIKYNCNSKYIVESKSLKLYLNSYNMTKMSSDIKSSMNKCKEQIKKDLSEALETDVQVDFVDKEKRGDNLFTDYDNILDYVSKDIVIEKFKEAPEVLEYKVEDKVNTHKLYFNSVRSNCRVTHQPDFAKVYIYYRSKKHIIEDSLLKYLVSFRKEYHFHEECTEMIYKRLYDLLDKDDELMVVALYTRRGGIDINPIRYSHNCNKEVLRCINELTDLKEIHSGNICQ